MDIGGGIARVALGLVGPQGRSTGTQQDQGEQDEQHSGHERRDAPRAPSGGAGRGLRRRRNRRPAFWRPLERPSQVIDVDSVALLQRRWEMALSHGCLLPFACGQLLTSEASLGRQWLAWPILLRRRLLTGPTANLA